MRSRFASARIIGLAVLALATQDAPASAQGFFNWFGGGGNQRQQQRQDLWFGGGERRQDSWFGQRQYTPQQPSAYNDPSATYEERYGPATAPSIGGNTGRSVAYCVRLCDGRYFPMVRHANANPVQLCSSFCPAAKTQVFNGSQIDYAVGNNGGRYADLENAFVYRKQIVAGCTCNGRDTFGLAPISVANDPTLRPGDIVSNGDNQKAALAAAANKQARNTVAEKPAAAAAKTKTPEPADLNPDTEERPED